nr:uncharacterized protein LOC104223091 [Ipomoea batatas]GMD84329.1 uncharacterized protein LOC104223091 [Ipomoea batatas]GMD90427.1 uncharacterized protein LOC104223091 [Ipomoea batatas]GME12269.1 uncharacterized protein LOC104223091 [Ipomoea batatas]
MMMIGKLEICIQVVKLAIEFVFVFVEAVSIVFCRSSDDSFFPATVTNQAAYIAPVTYVGFLP